MKLRTILVGALWVFYFCFFNTALAWHSNQVIIVAPDATVQPISDPCATDPLYSPSCPGYAQAYETQQCNANTLYSPSCPGYAKLVLDTYVTANENIVSVVTEPVQVLVTNNPVNELIIVSATGDPEIDSVLAASVVIVTSSPEIQEVISNDTTEENISDAGGAMDEQLDSAGDTVSNEPGRDSGGDATDAPNRTSESGTSIAGSTDKKESARDKVKQAMTERAQNLANQMSEAATVEAQQAVQAQLTAIMNFTPGFDAYGQMRIPGVDFYASEEIYVNAKISESRQGLRNGLAQQLLWDKLVEEQYAR